MMDGYTFWNPDEARAPRPPYVPILLILIAAAIGWSLVR